MQQQKELFARSNSSNSIFYKLKWHKFLIYFFLWIRMLLCFYWAYNLLSGRTWGEYLQKISQLFPKVRMVDSVFGLLFTILGCFIIFVRFRLAKFRRASVDLLQIQFLLFPLLIIFYYRAINSNAQVELYTFKGMESSIIIAAILIISSHFYYKKRNALFK